MATYIDVLRFSVESVTNSKFKGKPNEYGLFYCFVI